MSLPKAGRPASEVLDDFVAALREAVAAVRGSGAARRTSAYLRVE